MIIIIISDNNNNFFTSEPIHHGFPSKPKEENLMVEKEKQTWTTTSLQKNRPTLFTKLAEKNPQRGSSKWDKTAHTWNPSSGSSWD